jgi:hypothetical protein
MAVTPLIPALECARLVQEERKAVALLTVSVQPYIHNVLCVCMNGLVIISFYLIHLLALSCHLCHPFFLFFRL